MKFARKGAQFQAQLVQRELGLAVETECGAYLEERMLSLDGAMARVETLAARDQLPDTRMKDRRLRLSPLTNTVPDEAEVMIDRASRLLPRLKITDRLLEVDQWTSFTRHFTHLKSGASAGAQPGRRGHRALEHRLLGADGQCARGTRPRGG